MGADGHLTLSRIGDGQCWINDDLPQIKIEEPTAVFLKDARIWCTKPKRIYTYEGDISITIYKPEFRENRILESAFQMRPKAGRSAVEGEFSLMWTTFDHLRSIVPEIFDPNGRPQIRGTPADEHISAWEKLMPGVWVPTLYIRSGRDCWSACLDKRCEIKDEVTWEVWT